MAVKRVHAVLVFDSEAPERAFLLKSGFDKRFIEVYEDPTELKVRHVSESSVSKKVIDLLKTKGGD